MSHVRELGIVAPVWQMMCVQPRGKLDITMDELDARMAPS